MTVLTTTQILESGLDDWRKLSQALHARFRTGSFAKGARLLAAVAEAADAVNHHPDVTVRYPHVDIALISHDVGGITQRDVDLARRISELAREQGLSAQPEVLVEIEIGLDSADFVAQGPFWAALLTGDAEASSDDQVTDPSGRLPSLWFQPTEPHETPRQRFHLDVWVPHDVAEQRIAAAVAAGGQVVNDEYAPSFVALADPEGNRVCVCTTLNR